MLSEFRHKSPLLDKDDIPLPGAFAKFFTLDLYKRRIEAETFGVELLCDSGARHN